MIIIACCLALSGCGIGASIIGTVHSSIEEPVFGMKKGRLTSAAGRQEHRKIRKESLIEYWGRPDSVKTLPGRGEVLTYTFGYRWNGIGLWLLLLPVPLVVPVGHDSIDITILDGYAARADTSEEDHVFGGFCGITPLGVFGPPGLCYGAKCHEKDRVSDSFKLVVGRDAVIIDD